MEYQSPSFSIFPAFLVFVVIVWRIWSSTKFNTNSIAHIPPPGPRKLPLIGNIHQLVGSLPYRRLRDLAKIYGPVMQLRLGQTEIFVISSAETAEQVMKTHDLIFAQRPHMVAAHLATYNFTDVVFSPYGEYWRQMRKICTLQLLTSKCVQSFKSIREEEAKKLVTSLYYSTAGTGMNLSRILYSLTYSITTRSVSSMIPGKEAFMSTIKEYVRVVSGLTVADLFPSIKLLHVISGVRSKLERLHRELDEIMESIIKEHKDRGAVRSKTGTKPDDKDLADILLSHEEQGDLEIPFTTDNIKAIIHDLILAGTVTPATMVEWAMSELMRDPRVMEKAQAEVRQVFGRRGYIDEADLHRLHYLKLVIKETLRLHTPLPLLSRESRGHCKINGYDIPANSKVLVNVWAIAMDPNYWHEAERFYPERFLDNKIDYKGTDFEFLPFGAGRRTCPGKLFGIANLELPLANLLYHFNWELPAGLRLEDLDMMESFGAIANRKNDLLLVPIPYLTSPVN